MVCRYVFLAVLCVLNLAVFAHVVTKGYGGRGYQYRSAAHAAAAAGGGGEKLAEPPRARDKHNARGDGAARDIAAAEGDEGAPLLTRAEPTEVTL